MNFAKEIKEGALEWEKQSSELLYKGRSESRYERKQSVIGRSEGGPKNRVKEVPSCGVPKHRGEGIQVCVQCARVIDLN